MTAPKDGRDALTDLLLLALESGDATLDVRVGTTRVRMEVTPPASSEVSLTPGEWRQFSPLEELLVKGLKGQGWLTTAKLCALAGVEVSNEVRTVLRNLGERGVVELTQKHGVRLLEGTPDE